MFGITRGRYDTALTPQQEAAFQAWARGSGRAGDTQDYDLRGAWQGNAQAAATGHLPDTWKKPNHPTFSAESMYSTPDQTGGQWVQGPGGRWQFWASPWNMANLGPTGLENYFNRREPEARLILPIDYDLGRKK
jgi:hypothetical protein